MRRAIASGTVLWLLPCIPVHAQQPPSGPATFGTSVETVYLDVFVGENGEPVEGLAGESFQVEDNGVRQAVELVAAAQVPLRVILVFDVSGNLAGSGIERLKSAGRSLLASLAPGERVELLTFSHELRRLPGRSPAELQRALATVEAGGATALYDAAFTALALAAEGRESRPVVILFSDGNDVQSLLDAEAVYETARVSSATVYTVRTEETAPERTAVRGGAPAAPTRDMQSHDTFDLGARGPRANTNERFEAVSQSAIPRGVPERNEAPRFLVRLADETGGRALSVGAPDLESAFREILEDARTRYLLSYEPRGVEGPGWHEVSVKVRGRRASVRTRKGYYRPEAPSGGG